MKCQMKFVGYVVLEQARNNETGMEYVVVSQATGTRTPHEYKSEAIQAARFAARASGEPVYVTKIFARIDPHIETDLFVVGSQDPQED